RRGDIDFLPRLRIATLACRPLRGAEAPESRQPDVFAALQRRNDRPVLRVEDGVDDRSHLTPWQPRSLRKVLDELALVHSHFFLVQVVEVQKTSRPGYRCATGS